MDINVTACMASGKFVANLAGRLPQDMMSIVRVHRTVKSGSGRLSRSFAGIDLLQQGGTSPAHMEVQMARMVSLMMFVGVMSYAAFIAS
ncbi:hypothetical protein FZ942_20425 [Azospirillum lipoferum]|uniref:Uncharacterized protein n=2 Tax=Azospirillaceae TaxID=2829815 RepID=A0A5A9GJE3_AZOLI|nr:hypothetical protein FZ942_20425 [Azospirillum lipoferum]